MDVNDDGCSLIERVVLTFFASKLAPTGIVETTKGVGRACDGVGVGGGAVACGVEYPDQVQCRATVGGGLHGQRGTALCRADAAVPERAATGDLAVDPGIGGVRVALSLFADPGLSGRRPRAGLPIDARPVTLGGAGADADLCRGSADPSADFRHPADSVRHALFALAGRRRCAFAVVDVAGGGADRPVHRLLHLYRRSGIAALVPSTGLPGLGHLAQRLAVSAIGIGAQTTRVHVVLA
ncbi:hypothetical protein D3C78_1141770 [compost metagenome]